jgi:hypothetical protein
MLFAQTHALAEESRTEDRSLTFLIEIEVASDSGPLFSFFTPCTI